MRAAQGVSGVLQARESATEAEPPKPSIASGPSSSSCSSSASSSGRAATSLSPPGANTDASPPGRKRPEVSCAVVRGGDEQMAERVEHYDLDILVVRLGEHHARRDWRGCYCEHRARGLQCWRGAAPTASG